MSLVNILRLSVFQDFLFVLTPSLSSSPPLHLTYLYSLKKKDLLNVFTNAVLCLSMILCCPFEIRMCGTERAHWLKSYAYRSPAHAMPLALISYKGYAFDTPLYFIELFDTMVEIIISTEISY